MKKVERADASFRVTKGLSLLARAIKYHSTNTTSNSKLSFELKEELCRFVVRPCIEMETGGMQ